MILELILFILLTLIILRISKSNNTIENFQSSALLSGGIVTVGNFIFLFYSFDKMLKINSIPSEYTEFNAFILVFLKEFKPLLYGVLVKLILEPFRKKADSKIKREKLGDFENTETIENNKKLDFSLLSRREKEVANLAAQKYTNAQIAEELFISQETVKRHLSTIFGKLGISSRKDLENF
jgi:hypothetical protein